MRLSGCVCVDVLVDLFLTTDVVVVNRLRENRWEIEVVELPAYNDGLMVSLWECCSCSVLR